MAKRKNNRNKIRLGSFVFGTGLLMAFVIALFMIPEINRAIQKRKVSAAPFHKHFGVRVPKGYSILGIDVSRYQQTINWTKVKEMKSGGHKIQFVFAKAGEGYTRKDPQFENNRKGCKKAGIAFGAYHYFHPDLDPVRQADFFTSIYLPQQGNLPPVCDIEETKGMRPEKIRTALARFLNRLEQNTGMRPILYTYHSFHETNLKGYFESYPLWVAHYGARKPLKSRWSFWQFSERAKISGIKGNVDMNVFKGSITDLSNLKKNKRGL